MSKHDGINNSIRLYDLVASKVPRSRFREDQHLQVYTQFYKTSHSVIAKNVSNNFERNKLIASSCHPIGLAYRIRKIIVLCPCKQSSIKETKQRLFQQPWLFWQNFSWFLSVFIGKFQN